MHVRIKKGVGWNKGMEGQVFRVLSMNDANFVSHFKGIYPVEHPDNSDQGVKVLKKHNCEIVEDDEVMKVSNETVIEKLASIVGHSVEDLVSALKNLPGIEVKKNETIEPMKLSDRDLVVRNAIQFLEDLKCEGKESEDLSWEYRQNRHGKGFYHAGSGGAYNAEFIVDAPKRTVVCLLRAYHIPKHISRRGIAKCMPDDCFNEHIGKAIALAKALKEEIPAQFIDSPQPEGFEVGDIIKYRYIEDTTYRIETEEINGSSKLTILTCHNESLIGNEANGGNYGEAKVIDDSARYR